VLAGKLEKRLSLGSGESPEAKWTTFRYTLKKKKKPQTGSMQLSGLMGRCLQR
jgi:hypothetical protein